MQVIFDLRPPHLVQLQTQRVDVTRLFSVLLFVVFIFGSIFNIGYSVYRFMGIKRELDSTRAEQVSVQDNSTLLAARIAEMQAMKNRVMAYLRFTREELPAVEFLEMLERVVPSGAKVSAVEIRPLNVLLRGSAASDEEIIILATNLNRADYIITKVDAPVTTKSTLGTRLISDFAITCNIKSIMDVTPAVPSAGAAAGAEGSVAP
jgi:hypothetical protein